MLSVKNSRSIKLNTVYLLLGSNMGNSLLQLERAVQQLCKKVGSLKRMSKIYVTAAWGNTHQPDFLNQVLVIETSLPVQQLLQRILKIEASMGRIRTTKNAPRVIDIDILFFNKAVVDEPHLSVPHPQIQHRRFVLVPLNELAPNFRHPVLKQNIHQLLTNCTDPLNVKKN